MDQKSVFIIEDDEAYGKGLKEFIESCFPDIKDIKLFPLGEMSLLELCVNPAVIIADYFINNKFSEANNGLDIIKQIKYQKPKTNIIVLSAQASPGIILEIIRDFNCIYLQKDKDSFQHIKQIINKFINEKQPAILEPWA